MLVFSGGRKPVGSRNEALFLLLGRPPVTRTLSVGWSGGTMAAPTQFPPAASNFQELQVDPLPIQRRVYCSKRHVCNVVEFLRSRRAGRGFSNLKFSGGRRLPGGRPGKVYWSSALTGLPTPAYEATSDAQFQFLAQSAEFPTPVFRSGASDRVPGGWAPLWAEIPW